MSRKPLKLFASASLLTSAVMSLFAQSARTPDERFYPMVFRHVLATQQQPTPNSASVIPSMAFFSSKIGLNDNENTTLIREAQAWQEEVAPVDKAAYSMIAAIRAKTPGGRLAPGELPPVPPQELKAMQAQKDALTMKHVQNLHAMMGDDRFANFDQTIRAATQGRSAPVR